MHRTSNSRVRLTLLSKLCRIAVGVLRNSSKRSTISLREVLASLHLLSLSTLRKNLISMRPLQMNRIRKIRPKQLIKTKSRCMEDIKAINSRKDKVICNFNHRAPRIKVRTSLHPCQMLAQVLLFKYSITIKVALIQASRCLNPQDET